MTAGPMVGSADGPGVRTEAGNFFEKVERSCKDLEKSRKGVRRTGLQSRRLARKCIGEATRSRTFATDRQRSDTVSRPAERNPIHVSPYSKRDKTMQTMGKIQSEAAQTGSKKGNVLNIIIQVLIAALTALSGVFAGCSLPV